MLWASSQRQASVLGSNPMNCVSCQSKVPDASKFCGMCGAVVPERRSEAEARVRAELGSGPTLIAGPPVTEAMITEEATAVNPAAPVDDMGATLVFGTAPLMFLPPPPAVAYQPPPAVAYQPPPAVADQPPPAVADQPPPAVDQAAALMARLPRPVAASPAPTYAKPHAAPAPEPQAVVHTAQPEPPLVQQVVVPVATPTIIVDASLPSESARVKAPAASAPVAAPLAKYFGY